MMSKNTISNSFLIKVAQSYKNGFSKITTATAQMAFFIDTPAKLMAVVGRFKK
jgi:hypothetical protein